MRHIKSYESFEPVNEELFGGIMNFFKNIWNKATEDIKKLGSNPSINQIDEWIEKNPFNPQSSSYLFKVVIEEFKKKTEVNDETCLDLVKDIIDPEFGVMGKQGLNTLYDGLLKAFGKGVPTLDIVKFYMETSRDKVIKEYKYVLDTTKRSIDLKDTTHLPDLKKILSTITDGKKKKEATLKWVEGSLILRIDKYVDDITNEEVETYLKSKNITPPPSNSVEYKEGDEVIYLLKDVKLEDWEKLTPEQKKDVTKEPASKLVSTGKIKNIGDDKYTIEYGTEGKTTEKLSSELVGKNIQEKEDLSKKLTDLKSKKPEDINKVDKFVDFISNDANKDKIAEIDKILSGE